jgi:recombination protein RecA
MLLDCVLASTNEVGGWARGRIVNVVGDRSTGKTLLAVEACANFAQLCPIDNIRYVEAESAFDADYGEVVGMPHGIRPVDAIRTVEQFFDDLGTFCTEQRKNPYPSLYVLDSLDALSDDAELKRKMGDGTYGAEKAKLMSQTFRRLVKDVAAANCTLMVISQVRDKIGVMYGEKKTRTGGTALDFYASQIIWLAEVEKLKRTAAGIERVTGVVVRIRNRKNKLGPPYREAEQTMLFGYGIDDEHSMLKWLAKAKVINSTVQWVQAIYEARTTNNRQRIQQINAELRRMVWAKWGEVETQLAPIGRKYT